MQALDLKLLVSPTTLAMSDRAAFKVGLAIKNVGDKPVDPKAWDAALLVNDTRAPAWDLAVQNGPRDPSWDSLPPKQEISMSWPLGEAIFEAPGDYHLVLTLGGNQATADVHVRP